MMNQRDLFDESLYDISEQVHYSIVLAKKKIILPEMDKKDITIVNSNSGIIVTDSIEMIDLFNEQRTLVKMR